MSIEVFPPPTGFTPAGRTFTAELGANMTITTAPPTAPFAYGAGQPAVLLGFSPVVIGGLTRITATFNGFLQNDNPGALLENQPFVDVGLFVDGVQTARGCQTFMALQTATTVFIHSFSGSIEDVVVLAGGARLIEIRWGCSGVMPAATATINAAVAGAPNLDIAYATLVVEEVFA